VELKERMKISFHSIFVEFSTSNTGISGILRQQETKAKVTDSTLKEAFNDLSSLIEKSKEMIGLAEKLQQLHEKEHTTGTGKRERKKAEETIIISFVLCLGTDNDELRSMLVNIGIASPVTK
jgi:hypothetical protein